MGDLRGSAAIVGIAEMPPVKAPPPDREIDIMGRLVAEALRDAGLGRADVDGLLTVPPPGMTMLFPTMLAEYLGVRPRYADVVDLGGATAAGMVWRAAAAIATGMAETVVCAMSSVLDPARFARAFSADGAGAALGIGDFEAAYGPMGVNSSYAMAARRHMHEFGTTSAQLARIAVDQRTNALSNPNALYGKEAITVDDVLASRLVVDPLHLLEIVRPCSGGAAYVITSPERAADCRSAPVWLLGAGEGIGPGPSANGATVTTTPIAQAAPRAFATAGVTPADIDVLSVYDCYTIMVLLTLEDAGFCPKGEGGPFVESTDLTAGGDLPVNTHGGQLSFGQAGIAGGASHIVEAVRQIRGEAGEAQVPSCELAFVNGNGGTMGEETSLVFGRSR